MDKYLLELLKIENTVIIPGIGALMVTNSKTGSFMFNPHLKFNDHLLEKYVEENSNMDANESVNFVAKYAREIQASLDKGESYSIYGLGSLTKENDEIVFNQDEGGKASKPAAVKPEPKVETPKKEEPKEAVKQEEVKPNPPVKSETPEKKETKTQKEEVKVTPPINNPTKEKKTEAVNKYTEPKSEKKSAIQEEKQKNQVKTGGIPVVTTEQKKEALEKAGLNPSKTMEKAQKDKKPKKKRGILIVLLLLLLLIGGGGAFLGMNWNKYKTHFAFLGIDDTEKAEDKEKDTKDSNKDSETDADSENETNANANDNLETLDTTASAVDSSVEIEAETQAENFSEETTDSGSNENETVSEPVVEEEVKIVESNDSFESNGSTSKNGDYHVVVGLFSVPENASNLVSKLKGEGHKASILGKFDGMDMVIVKSFSSKQDAINAMRNVRNSIEDRAWVFHY